MIIKKISIDAFGKLENYNCDLSDGFQIIYGVNEFGKSTIMNFLNIMFYGKKNKSRKKYLPWSGKKMSGAIEFFYKNDLYRLQKSINPVSSLRDEVVLQNISSGKTISLEKNEDVGEHIFGFDSKSFEKSVYVSGIGKAAVFVTPKNSAKEDTITSKILSNLSDTCDEELCSSDALNNIESALKELKKQRGKDGKIDVQIENIENLKKQIFNVETFEKNQEELKAHLRYLVELQEEKNALSEVLEKNSKFEQLENIQNLLNMIEKRDYILKSICVSEEKFNDTILATTLLKNKIESEKSNLENFCSTCCVEKSDVDISDKECISMQKFITEKENLHKILENSLSSKSSEYNNLIQKKNQLEDKIKNYELQSKKYINEKNIICKKYEKFKKINFCLQILNTVFLGLSIYFGYYVMLILLPLAASSLLWSGIKFFKFKNNLKSLEKQIDEINVLQLSKEKSELESNLIEIIGENEKLRNDLRLNIEKINFKIGEMLKEKNCSSVSGYYAQYDRCKQIHNNVAYRDSELLKIEKLKSEFIEKLSFIEKSKNYNEAVRIFDKAINLKKELELLESKIKNTAQILKIKNLTKSYLKSEIEKLINKDQILLDDSEKLQKINRFEYLKTLKLEEEIVSFAQKLKVPEKSSFELKKEIEKENIKLENMQKYYSALKVAKEVIEEIIAERRSGFNPQLDNLSSEIFCSLTGGKYKNIHVKSDYSMMVRDNIMDRECEFLSSGTVDQAYLALRLAIAKLISANNDVPIILDDSFMQYDDNRLELAINFLKDYSKTNSLQIILFTCHKYIKQLYD